MTPEKAVVIDADLASVLARSNVRVDEVDADTICLHNAPADARHFSKPSTNVLVRRPREGLPFLVCVDEDFEYTGSDPDVARVFAGAGRRQGWRVLPLTTDARHTVNDVVQFALGVVGFGGREPAVQPTSVAATSAARGAYATSISALVAGGKGDPCVGRSDQVEEAICCLAQRYHGLPLIAGPSGVGKTNFLYGAVRMFEASGHPL